jgi:hypothetical protein
MPTGYAEIARTPGPNGEGPSTFDADVLGRLNGFRRWGLDLDRIADYVLYREGTSYRASGAAGVFSGAEPGVVLQSAITALGTRGGTIVLTGDDDFAWGSVPAVPAGITGRLTIRSHGRAKVVLSGTGPRFLDPASTGSTQNVTLQGIVVDATAIQTDTQGHHLLFGNARAGVLYSQIDFRGIRILGCKVLNGRVGTVGSQGQTAVYFATQHTAAGQAQNVIEDIIVDDLTVTGCLQGVALVGIKSGTWTGEPAIWVDNWTVRNIHHDLGSVPPGFAGSAHVHIGSRAQVGRGVVENVYGYGSRDVGIEVNNFQDARITNAVFEEYNGYAVLLANHRPPRRVQDQQAIVRNVSGRHLAANGAVLSNACSLVATVSSSVAAHPMGSVVVQGGKYYRDVPSITASGLSGIALIGTGEFRSLTVEDFESHLVGINHTDTATGANPRPFYFDPRTSTALLRLRRCLSVANGTAAAGATAVNLYHFDTNGLAVLDVDDISARMDIAGASDFGHRLMQIGRLAGSNIRGTIRRPKVLSAAATQARGIVVSGTGSLTIPNEIRVGDGDFSAMPSPSLDVFVDATQATKVRTEGNKWRVFPLPPVGVAVGTSPWPYQATQGYRESIIVSGGTVSLIEFSRDGATWFGLGETAGMFVLDPGDRLRITHTAAPTVTRIPAK